MPALIAEHAITSAPWIQRSHRCSYTVAAASKSPRNVSLAPRGVNIDRLAAAAFESTRRSLNQTAPGRASAGASSRLAPPAKPPRRSRSEDRPTDQPDRQASTTARRRRDGCSLESLAFLCRMRLLKRPAIDERTGVAVRCSGAVPGGYSKSKLRRKMRH